MAASTHKTTMSEIQPYIKALATYGKTLPSTGGPGYKPQGVTIRSKLPNQFSAKIPHPSGRPPAEHYVRMLAKQVTGVAYKPKTVPSVHIKTPTVHPAKAIRMRNVKAIHLGHPTVKKVTA